MAHVSVIGKGTMGTAIAGIVTAGGSTVETFDTSSGGQRLDGDVVVLAVPYGALEAIVDERGDELADKVVVDITNPVDFETFDSLVVPPDSSAAAQLAERLPRSRVLKAFNTNFAATLASGTLAGRPTQVLIAGDDDAKALLADVVTAGGLDAVDAGSLRRARELEAVGFLQMTLAAREKIAWTGGFSLG